jgi:hypothetical protein
MAGKIVVDSRFLNHCEGVYGGGGVEDESAVDSNYLLHVFIVAAPHLKERIIE